MRYSPNDKHVSTQTFSNFAHEKICVRTSHSGTYDGYRYTLVPTRDRGETSLWRELERYRAGIKMFGNNQSPGGRANCNLQRKNEPKLSKSNRYYLQSDLPLPQTSNRDDILYHLRFEESLRWCWVEHEIRVPVVLTGVGVKIFHIWWQRQNQGSVCGCANFIGVL